jgi:DNA helicase-2/ATP-dependent DNA helicase PcrA
MDHILEDAGYRDYIDDGSDDGRERWENVMELRRLAAEYQEKGLELFLEDVALVSDQDTLEATANAPTLLTLHAAKGLEYPVVFIIGLSDGTLPHVRSFEDPEAMQEERRLFYVGITRARDRLYLVIPLNRSAYGYSEPVEESRFVKDIPGHLIMESGRSTRQARLPYPGRTDRWEDSKTAPIMQARYRAGVRVNHPVWGEGMVLNSRIQDDDEIVDIFFAGVGLKRVSASLAKLEIKSS